MSKSQAVLIRPGCTDFDEQNRIQGTLDIPLNEQGQEQVRQIAEELRDIPLQKIYSAPCASARATATSLGAALKVPVKEIDALVNLDQGLWQGMAIDDIRRKHPKVFKQWQESPETICPPEGEEVSEAMERIKKAVNKIVKRRKKDFAIIAPEPLVSLIRWHLCGGKLRATEPLGSCGSGQRWELLKLNGAASGKQEGKLPQAEPVVASPAPTTKTSP